MLWAKDVFSLAGPIFEAPDVIDQASSVQFVPSGLVWTLSTIPPLAQVSKKCLKLKVTLERPVVSIGGVTRRVKVPPEKPRRISFGEPPALLVRLRYHGVVFPTF
jgi:hypothetical protein